MKSLIFAILFISVASFGIGPQFVTNANIFLGEVASNLTTGSPLSVSSTGKIQSGIPFYQSTTSTATTCTTTQAAMSGISITPVAGTYQMTFSTDYNSANGGTVVTVSMYESTTQIAISQRKFQPFAGGTLTSGNQRIPLSMTTIQVLTGTAITVQCSTSANTVTTANAELDLVRLL